MSSVVETPPKKKVSPSPMQSADLLEVAKTARDAALDFARLKLPTVKKDLDLEFLLRQRDFLCAFKNALVENTCRVIGDYDAKALASYYFEPCTNPDAHLGEEVPIDGTLNIILVVKSKTAGLEAFINSLDRALTTALKELPLPLLDSYDSVLNVIPVTEEDIEKGKGYAVLLSSVHAPALKVWECS
jgi:hypothetical protein